VRAVVGNLVADAVDDDGVVLSLDLRTATQPRQLGAHAVARAPVVDHGEERVGEGVLEPDQQPDDLLVGRCPTGHCV
jgi:hypothetical protein